MLNFANSMSPQCPVRFGQIKVTYLEGVLADFYKGLARGVQEYHHTKPERNHFLSFFGRGKGEENEKYNIDPQGPKRFTEKFEHSLGQADAHGDIHITNISPETVKPVYTNGGDRYSVKDALIIRMEALVSNRKGMKIPATLTGRLPVIDRNGDVVVVNGEIGAEKTANTVKRQYFDRFS